MDKILSVGTDQNHEISTTTMTLEKAKNKLEEVLSGLHSIESLSGDEILLLSAHNAPLLADAQSRLTQLAEDLELLASSDLSRLEVDLRKETIRGEAIQAINRILTINQISALKTARVIEEVCIRRRPKKDGPLHQLIKSHYGSQARFAEEIGVTQTSVSNWTTRHPSSILKYQDEILGSGHQVTRRDLISAVKGQERYIRGGDAE